MKFKYYCIITFAISNFLNITAISNLINSFFPLSSDCVMVGSYGGGYSGFWYYYGKLQDRNEYYLDKKLYCFSSGCLAIISSIQHNNYNYLRNVVKEIKVDYDNNILNRFDVRNEFIYRISNKVTDISKYNLNILTSNYFGNCTIINPQSIEELIDALNKTTSIPLITSKFNISQNIDGGFCINKYPICKIKIQAPLTYKFLVNIFNPNMNEDLVINYFMNYNKK